MLLLVDFNTVLLLTTLAAKTVNSNTRVIRVLLFATFFGGKGGNFNTALGISITFTIQGPKMVILMPGKK